MSQPSIQKTFFKIVDFITWQKSGALKLSPEFQRRAVWKPGAKSYLIDTIVKGLPIPIIFIRNRVLDVDNPEPIREVVDGQQRLRTVITFVAPHLLKDFDATRDDFKVKKSHNPYLAGKAFKDLDADTKNMILDYEFNVHVLPARMDDREIIQIFRRMNSVNYSLNKQELRSAAYYGEFKTSVYTLGEEHLQIWRKWKTFTEDNIARMQEAEFVSECLIMISDSEISGKSATKIDSFYNKYDDSFPHREEIEKRFRVIMDSINIMFIKARGNFAFTKKTLLYTICSYLYSYHFGFANSPSTVIKQNKLTEQEIDRILHLNQKIIDRIAPVDVLESTDRRTTNPKERKRLFRFLSTGR